MVRGLGGHADDVVVCDPQRDHWIAKDSDKDDPIDVEKLARLYHGGVPIAALDLPYWTG